MKAVNGMMSQRINQSFMDYSDSAADLVLLADSFSSHASAAHEWQDGRSSAASGASGDEPQQPAGRSKSFSSGKLQHLGSADEDSIPAVHRSSKSMTISGRPPLKGSIHRQRSTAAGELSHAGSGRFGSALQSARKSIAAAPSLGLASPKEAPGRQTMGLLPSLQPVRHILTPDNVEVDWGSEDSSAGACPGVAPLRPSRHTHMRQDGQQGSGQLHDALSLLHRRSQSLDTLPQDVLRSQPSSLGSLLTTLPKLAGASQAPPRKSPEPGLDTTLRRSQPFREPSPISMPDHNASAQQAQASWPSSSQQAQQGQSNRHNAGHHGSAGTPDRLNESRPDAAKRSSLHAPSDVGQRTPSLSTRASLAPLASQASALYPQPTHSSGSTVENADRREQSNAAGLAAPLPAQQLDPNEAQGQADRSSFDQQQVCRPRTLLRQKSRVPGLEGGIVLDRRGTMQLEQILGSMGGQSGAAADVYSPGQETGSRLQRTTTTAQVLLLDVPLEHILRAESPTEAGSAAANEANSLSGCQADGDQGWAARNAGGLASCLSTRSSVRWQLDDADSAGDAMPSPQGSDPDSPASQSSASASPDAGKMLKPLHRFASALPAEVLATRAQPSSNPALQRSLTLTAAAAAAAARQSPEPTPDLSAAGPALPVTPRRAAQQQRCGLGGGSGFMLKPSTHGSGPATQDQPGSPTADGPASPTSLGLARRGSARSLLSIGSSGDAGKDGNDVAMLRNESQAGADDGGEAGAMPEGREGALCTYDKTRWRRLEDFAALSTIADGRNTHVYLGVTKDAKQATVAIKAYYKAHMGPGAGRHLALERELLRTLRHPHIVQGFGEFEDEAANYLVQEFAEGDNLLHYIRHHQSLARREGLSHTACMPEQEIAVRIAAPLLDALALLHSRGIVHCDLKPENLVFQRGVLKVIDLGLAIDVAVDKLHCKVGTLHYLSPEVIAANPPQGAAATKLDIWGLGIVVWELLTGRTPFYHESRNITMSLITEAKLPLDDLTRLHVSSQCKDFLTVTLHKDPALRPSAAELMHHPWIMACQQKGASHLPHKVQHADVHQSDRHLRPTLREGSTDAAGTSLVTEGSGQVGSSGASSVGQSGLSATSRRGSMGAKTFEGSTLGKHGNPSMKAAAAGSSSMSSTLSRRSSSALNAADGGGTLPAASYGRSSITKTATGAR